MTSPLHRISIAEDEARALTLAEAIETTDAPGKLIGKDERDAIDRRLGDAMPLQSTPDSAEAAGEGMALLNSRASQIVKVAANRSPALAALAQRRPWTRAITWAAPLAAVLLGAATDRIANPHRVDLLSLPLLAIVAWNLAVYAALLLGYVLQRSGREPDAPSFMSTLLDRAAAWQPRAGAAQARATAAFFQKWQAVTGALQAARLRKVLHLAAAGWALGVVLSLFARGLVVEYRIGWESTFLDAAQVHTILRGLLLPVLAVFPFDSFSVQDIAALRFSESGAAASTTASSAGARWVYLYASLLALVVILPRLLLAAWARLREQHLARHMPLSLDSAYYRRILALAHPARVRLGLIALRDDDQAALLRALKPHAQVFDARELAAGGVMTLIRAPGGELLLADRIAPHSPAMAAHSPAPAVTAGIRSGWSALTFGKFRRVSNDAAASPAGPPQVPHANHVPPSPRDALLVTLQRGSEVDTVLPLLRELAAPLLILVRQPALHVPAGAALHAREHESEIATCRTRAAAAGLDAEVLGFDSFARCWMQQPVLLDAIGRSLPATKREGFARLAETQRQYHRERFTEAMAAIVQQLGEAAGDVEPVRTAPASLTRLIRPSERQADAQARSEATAALAERLRAGAHRTQATLLRLHGLDASAGGVVDAIFESHLIRHSAPVNTRDAGMAGAATGAATGASVDLITGGLTLGAAALLGGVIGGSAALVGAAWKNRATPGGTATVQASDDMLHALLQAALLAYFDAVHREPGEATPSHAADAAPAVHEWSARLETVLAQHREKLDALWLQTRQAAQPAARDALNQEVQAITREVLHAMYPAAPMI